MKSFVHKHPVLAYFFLTFVITWTCWLTVFMVFEPYRALPELAPATLLIILEILAKIGACGPGIAAIILTLMLYGKSELRELVNRIFRWRVNPIYYVFALLMPIAIFMIPLSIELMLGESFPNTIVVYGLLGFIFHFLVRLLLGNYEEEIGWRGFAQHHLQKTQSPIKMSFIIGLPHALWHIPMFLIEEGSIDLLVFLIYTIRVVIFTFLVTWLYSKTQSILLTALLHVTVNESSLFLAVNTFQGIFILMVLIAIVGIILILFYSENRTNVDDIVKP
ncbi:MAG: CPBP family intramembrane metalloprotease [Candidatus Lokiarchaeota archaeon]|nr:CPBP family intramembrane metalloprotease [Candidatus Lokiarchaeota archaeon]